MSAPFFWNWRTLALALGAAVGIGFAWLLEFSGHSSWAVLLLIVGAVVPSGLGLEEERSLRGGRPHIYETKPIHPNGGGLARPERAAEFP